LVLAFFGSGVGRDVPLAIALGVIQL
jgi:hypothetical protein